MQQHSDEPRVRGVIAPQSFQAGMATVECEPPIGVDLVGFLRRHQPTQAHGRHPLEVSALVADDGHRRVAVVALDLGLVVGSYALHLREIIARAAGCSPDRVLVNCQHTHSAPPPPGLIKMGGLSRDLSPQEQQYWENLVLAAGKAASLAASRLGPARMGTGSSLLDNVSVNRRERIATGEVILGYSPSGPCDRAVSVLRFELDDRVATVVNFACHPTVLGPDTLEASSDYVGPLRTAVREWTGGECMFLQGCAGNVVPLNSVWDVPGYEITVGRAVALEALRASAQAHPAPRRLDRTEYRSAVPMARYRWVDDGEFESNVDSAEQEIELRLENLPSIDEVRALRADLQKQVAQLRSSGAGPEKWISIDLHALWAKQIEEQIANGSVKRALRRRVQVIRINQAAIVGLPGEPFNEIGTVIKNSSRAPFTMVCGYTNEALGYVPTSDEYPFGGYEVSLSHRHYGYAAPLARGADHVLQDTARNLLDRLFPAKAGAIA